MLTWVLGNARSVIVPISRSKRVLFLGLVWAKVWLVEFVS
jgi:hypothetical protein